MARGKKPEPIKQEPVSLNLMAIVDDFNADAFKLCVSQLYPLFGYRVLQETDIRPVDLKEQLCRFEELFLLNDEEKEKGSLLMYAQYLQSSVKAKIECAKTSRAEKYYLRTLELLVTYKTLPPSINDLEDAVLIFVCLMKEVRKQSDIGNEALISDVDFSNGIDDITIFDEVFLNANGEDENRRRKLRSSRKKTIIENDKNKALYLFIVSEILYCHVLKQRGLLGVEVV